MERDHNFSFLCFSRKKYKRKWFLFSKFGRLWLVMIIESWSYLVVDDQCMNDFRKWVINVFRVWQVRFQLELVCVCFFFFYTLLLEQLLRCRYCIYSLIVGDKVPNSIDLKFPMLYEIRTTLQGGEWRANQGKTKCGLEQKNIVEPFKRNW